ncbi:MAG: xanthine dehydrogenase family protein subunit M [Thermoplasmata archaeon]|nr:xanthine dehydrogenase family protein subunit M [Thermoplasmata archaeon]
MIPPKFDYHAPGTVDEAIGLLQKNAGDAKVLAGGQSLLPLMKLRLAEPKMLIDISRIAKLSYIQEDPELLRVGAATKINDLNDSQVIRSRYPMLADAGAHIADPLVRNMGTVGGNVCHGDPGNDLPACMLAIGARYVVRGPKGDRTIAAKEFYRDTFVTALDPAEILTEVQIPKAQNGDGGAYMKMERKVGDFAIAAVAVHLRLDSKGTVTSAGIALTNVGPTVLMAGKAASSLVGHKPTDADFLAAGKLAAEAAQPASDMRGPAEFKKGIVQTLTRRALHLAWGRAGGKS